MGCGQIFRGRRFGNVCLWALGQADTIVGVVLGLASVQDAMIVDENTIRKAAELLHQAAPGAGIILFGSYARRQPTPDSDLDFLVVLPHVTSRIDEMVRLRRVLSPLRVPADVLVVAGDQFAEWRDMPGSVYYEAAREGRVLYDAA